MTHSSGHWTLTSVFVAPRVQFLVNLCEMCDWRNGSRSIFSLNLIDFTLLVAMSPLLRTRLPQAVRRGFRKCCACSRTSGRCRVGLIAAVPQPAKPILVSGPDRTHDYIYLVLSKISNCSEMGPPLLQKEGSTIGHFPSTGDLSLSTPDASCDVHFIR